MSFRVLSLSSITFGLLLATACSSHWSAAAGSRRVGLDLRAGEPEVFLVDVVLERTDDQPLPCEGLYWSLELEFDEATRGGVSWTVTRDGEAPGEAESHELDGGESLQLQAGQPWTSVDADTCRAGLVVTLETPHALRGGFRLEAVAEDASAASGDEPGATTFAVSVQRRAEDA